jgi:hypothetical protein
VVSAFLSKCTFLVRGTNSFAIQRSPCSQEPVFTKLVCFG